MQGHRRPRGVAAARSGACGDCMVPPSARSGSERLFIGRPDSSFGQSRSAGPGCDRARDARRRACRRRSACAIMSTASERANSDGEHATVSVTQPRERPPRIRLSAVHQRNPSPRAARPLAARRPRSPVRPGRAVSRLGARPPRTLAAPHPRPRGPARGPCPNGRRRRRAPPLARATPNSSSLSPLPALVDPCEGAIGVERHHERVGQFAVGRRREVPVTSSPTATPWPASVATPKRGPRTRRQPGTSGSTTPRRAGRTGGRTSHRSRTAARRRSPKSPPTTVTAPAPPVSRLFTRLAALAAELPVPAFGAVPVTRRPSPRPARRRRLPRARALRVAADGRAGRSAASAIPEFVASVPTSPARPGLRRRGDRRTNTSSRPGPASRKWSGPSSPAHRDRRLRARRRRRR